MSYPDEDDSFPQFDDWLKLPDWDDFALETGVRLPAQWEEEE